MSIPLSTLIEGIDPTNTILFFGSGSSIPSGAPSVATIIEKIGREFNLDTEGFSLTEITSIAEAKKSRKELVSCLRTMFNRINVTGALLNLPLYKWKNIYTTNYDKLVEQSYEKKDKPLSVISSNYDFREQKYPEATKLYKLHGCIDKDISDGNQSRIIISESDYDNTSEYRDFLWDAFKNDLNGGNIVIIGYSLADSHIKDIVDRAISNNNKSYSPATINLVLYTKDENRALLLERRGVRVSFGSVDDFFVELQKKTVPSAIVYKSTGDPLDNHSNLQPVTLKVDDELKNFEKNVGAMFQGWPATYSDIKAKLTFDRTIITELESTINDDSKLSVYLLGASGMGKSTSARKVILRLRDNGYHCWEHKGIHKLLFEEWRSVATALKDRSEKGVLFIDDAHNHLFEINNLIDLLSTDDNFHLKIILTSTRNHWYPRVKTPNIFLKGKEFILKKLDEVEVEGLLSLVETHPDLQPLIESSFSGFSRAERKRRLVAKCESDTFVCLKNIFASEQFDDIVLREYAELDANLQNIYKLVSAMESAGINVHRQLVIRLLGIQSEAISASLVSLVDIIHEYTISDREGIYGWRGRHPVITDIISKYKMSDEKEYYKLFEMVIDNIIPTYDVEIRTIKQLCSFDEGISRFPDKHLRNKLLRKMISKAPGERVPRHRLIRYLIDVNELEKAETEIRLFENDFKTDGPLERFKIILLLARADSAKGILSEDRIAILEMARDKAIKTVERYRNNKNILKTYCDVGLEIFKRTIDSSVFEDAMQQLRSAEIRLADPEITSSLIYFERQYSHIQSQSLEEVNQGQE
ncbi:MAG: SIR2 family protein [Gammaproteobacteria bacterium]|uniref:SIR2 family protein n=1 Tax=Shewanella baltica TaxID=62322 RepID=UPI001C73D2EE|nr:SIR2 family protein [Gammaproteobacteria bacterium]QYX65677.1 SIR2 family protein [Shewanella putrefaciens]MBU1477542.1 SIR2 family protein [Gammaproteobacteria bacterium]MBU2002705.1 SIR2 family protein [Gammaproteobacteria bacterium]MBU2131880.1 SIR2 family protein [Gammaproteobacteria bacterium]